MRQYDIHLTQWDAPGAPYRARFADAHEEARWYGLYFRRDYWEITAFLSGEGSIVTRHRDGRITTRPTRPGQMFLWRPQDLNTVVPHEPIGVRFVQVCFPTAEWLTFANLVGFPLDQLTAADAPATTFDVEDEGVLSAFRAAVDALGRGATMMDLVGFWSAVVPRLLPRPRRHDVSFTGPPWLFRAVELMRAEDNLRAGLPRLLELAHVSSRQLARSTQRYYGMTPTNLIADLRIREAARLLVQSADSISAISRRVGFDDAAHFSRRFRQATSITPREFRERSAEPGGPRR